ncbi:MAG: carboxylesterase family protein [Bacteroidales bacterium]
MRAFILILIFSPGIQFLSCEERQLSTIITTDAGRARGTQGNGFKSFKGIPFAAPPVGDLRWKEPCDKNITDIKRIIF